MLTEDWRRQGQEKYLKGVTLRWQEYRTYRSGWDHDHCEFCGIKFSENLGDLKNGYSTQNGYHWICKVCFDDFKEEFLWRNM